MQQNLTTERSRYPAYSVWPTGPKMYYVEEIADAVDKKYWDGRRASLSRIRAIAASPPPRKSGKKEPIPMKNCDHCGELFQPKIRAERARFCDSRCQAAYRQKDDVRIQTKICPCGTEFMPAKINASRAKYCSPVCRQQAMEARKAERRAEANAAREQYGKASEAA